MLWQTFITEVVRTTLATAAVVLVVICYISSLNCGKARKGLVR